jgi:nucleoid-associated protein YgaU
VLRTHRSLSSMGIRDMARRRKLLVASLVLASGASIASLFLKPNAGQWLKSTVATVTEAPAEPAAKDGLISKSAVSETSAKPAVAPPSSPPVAQVDPPKKPAPPPVATPGEAKPPVSPTPGGSTPAESSTLKAPPWATGAFPSRPVFGSKPGETKAAPANPQAQPAEKKAEAAAPGTTLVIKEQAPQGELFNRLNKGSAPVVREETPPARPETTAGNTAAPAVSETTETKTHTVRDGDTLRKLAERYLGDSSRFLEIYESNRQLLRSPEVLPIGARLSIVVRPFSGVPPREAVRIPAETASLPVETSPSSGLRPLRPLRPLVPVPPDAFKRPARP